jgi:hypothetical protein
MRAYLTIALLALSAAGATLAAFTLDSFRTLQTSVSATTTNLCTNVVVNVSEFDTVALQFRGSLAGAGDSSVAIVFQRGLSTNVMDTGTFATWVIDTSSWTKGSTNLVSTNLFSVRDFRGLGVYSIANGNTSTISAVSLSYGAK